MRFFIKLYLVISFYLINSSVYSQEVNIFNFINEIDLYKVQNEIISSIPDGRCKEDLFKVFGGLIQRKMWALEMLDSWAKPQMGLLTGNIMHIGNYDECLEINENNVRGQYCSVIIKPTFTGLFNATSVLLNELGNQLQQQLGDLGNVKTSTGICTPNSCTPETLEIIFRQIDRSFQLGLEFKFEEFLCDYKGKREFTSEALISCVIFLVIILLILTATIYDLSTLQTKARLKPLISISAYENTKKLLSITKSQDRISCLNGLKFISMFWIILGHKYMIIIYVPYINTKTLEKWIENPLNTTIIAASFAVDTFFVISGLLVSYSFFKATSKNVKFNVFKYWGHRLIRLTPSLAALVLFLTTLVQYLGDGPLWDLVLKMTQSDCQKNWWAILLYVQNYVYPHNNCAPQAWYLAIDTQMYFLAPILLIPFKRWPKKTLFGIVLLIFGSIGWTFVTSWKKDLDLMYYNGSLDFYSFYISTHFRASSWLIGLILGYILFTMKTRKVSLNKILIICLWIISISTLSAVVFGHFSFIANQHSQIRSSVFNAFSRPAWCLAICWIIFACYKGYGGPINKFLSLGIFNIGVKISYGIYLLHVVEILYSVGTGRVAKYFSNEEELRIIWSDFITTIFFSFIWVLIFELPPISLENIFKQSKNNKVNNEDTENGIVK